MSDGRDMLQLLQPIAQRMLSAVCAQDLQVAELQALRSAAS